MNKIVWVDSISGDWCGIYDTDGLLIHEGHSISGFLILEYFSGGGIKPFELVYEEADSWLEEDGSLPFKVEEFYEKQGE